MEQLNISTDGPWALSLSFLQAWAHSEREAGHHAARLTAGRPEQPQQRGNIAVFALEGVLTAKSGWFGTPTRALGDALKVAVQDPTIGAVILKIDTPGGSVVGTPELAGAIFEARKTKPIYGYVEGLCASAGYWIASACTELYSTPSASVGSIGIYTTHTDVSGAMKKAGIKEELISAGKFKTEGNSIEPLGTEGRAALQKQVNDFYAMFVGTVAKGRNVPVATVRSGYGQGRCLLAGDALREGMIDGVCSFDEVVNKTRKAINPAYASGNRAAGQRELVSSRTSISAAQRSRLLDLIGC